MKKYLWIAGGAALLISAFLGRNGVSHAQTSGDIKQNHRDPRRLERARRKPAKLAGARKTSGEYKKDASATYGLRAKNRANHQETRAGKPRK